MMNHVQLTPFGVEITAPEGATLGSLDLTEVRAAVALHRFALLRGFIAPEESAILAFCRQLGEIAESDFGSGIAIPIQADAHSDFDAAADQPFHWDGTLTERPPHYLFFHCNTAPDDAGGETVFCNTVSLLEHATLAQRERWDQIRVIYSNGTLASESETWNSPLIANHPVSGMEVLRFAQPIENGHPVHLSISGIPAESHAEFLAEMHHLLNDPQWCYAHSWRENDILIADNHALLQSRRAFRADAPHRFRRVNIV